MRISAIKKYLFHRWQIFLLGVFGLSYLVFNFISFGGTSFENYPYIHQDLWRRLGDSLFYLGKFNTPYMHPPLPSLIYSVFISTGSFQFFWINALFFVLGMFFIFMNVSNILKSRNLGLIAALLYFFNYYNFLYSSMYGLVDMWCAVLILGSIYFFFRYLENRKTVFAVLAGLFIGTSLLVQDAGLALLPIIPMILLIDKNFSKEITTIKSNHAKYNFLLIFIIPFLYVIALMLYKQIAFGDMFYSQIEHIGYLGFTFNNLNYYAWNFVVYFSVPVVILMIVGVISSIRQLRSKYFKTSQFYVVLLVLPYLVFFVFLYTWKDIRFMSYLILPVYMFAVIGLKSCFTKLFKRNNIATLLVVFAVCFYTSLVSQGEVGINLVISVLKVDVGLFDYVGTGKIELIDFKESPQTYFTYMSNFSSHVSNDPMLQYYLVKTNPVYSMGIVNVIKDSTCDNVQIILSDENFVRNMQLSYYMRCNFKSVTEKELQNNKNYPYRSKYIITDKDYSSTFSHKLEGYSNYREIAKNSVYFLYERE